MSKAKTIFSHIGEEYAVCSMAFIGGFVDAVGFVKLHHLFTSSITGNLVVAVASVETNAGALCRVIVSLSFFVAAALAYTFALRLKCVYELTLPSLSISMLTCEIMGLAVTLLTWAFLHHGVHDAGTANNFNIILVGSLLSGSMGIHNVAAKESIANCPATTVMTTTMIIVSGHLSNTVNFWFAKRGWLNLFAASVTDPTKRQVSRPTPQENSFFSSCFNILLDCVTG